MFNLRGDYTQKYLPRGRGKIYLYKVDQLNTGTFNIDNYSEK